ncbi:uncharacterized protein [Musca autumnalis]|uniref:uncharacterized protein n=1 Tax=Musca autumnalis TaxID=221902 RepID=UPI003CFA7737
MDFEDTETVKVGFYGDDHPSWIVFNRTVLVVDTYYPAVRQCYNCGRLGHTKMGCRSNERCLKCGEEGCDKKCGMEKCILCGGKDHNCNNKKKCPKWAEEIEINMIMTRKKITKREVIEKYKRQNRFELLWDDNNFPSISESHKKSNGGKQANPTTIDDDVNAILTPFTYNSVAKKPKKQYVHKPGVQMAKRMFEEPSPKAPVFVKENQKVTELEKVTKELLKFMEDFFKKDNNQVALEAMSHFQQRILKCGVPMDAVEHQQSISQHDGVSQESHKKSNGGKQANPTTIDDDVNAILTPFTYNSVAKKPKKQYVHKPGVQMAKRMFEEPSPKAPVFVKENQKVTELEKVTKELLKFMEDFFKKDNNQVALEAMSHFQQRILKCGVPMDAVEHQQSISQHDGVSQAST